MNRLQTFSAEAGGDVSRGVVVPFSVTPPASLPARDVEEWPSRQVGDFEAQRAIRDDSGASGELRQLPATGRNPSSATTCASSNLNVDGCLLTSTATGERAAVVITDAELVEAEGKEKLIREWRRLQRDGGFSGRKAAEQLGRPASWFSQIVPAYDARGFEALLPKRAQCGAKAKVAASDDAEISLPAWFVAACQFFYLRTNRNRGAGSVPAAVRCALSLPKCQGHLVKPLLKWLETNGCLLPSTATLPVCPEILREELFAREREGKAILPVRLRREIAASPLVVEAVRSPRNAWLRRVESPGSLMLTIDEDGSERYLEPGEWETIDDATINFPSCVALARPGDPCWDKWGVSLGRFQFLLEVDHRSYCITGFSYTARPRSSYRAEDLTATMLTTFLTHGAPKFMVMENGISAANLVKHTLDAIGVGIIRVKSPHQKVVEGVFNKLWTKLSLERGQVGRFRGEEEEGNKLLERCRTGAHDPRKYFPMLADVLQTLREAIAAHNSTPINGRYGRWVPQEFFNQFASKHRKPLDPARAWAFSPVITEPLVVRSMCIKTSVPLMPGYSHRFAFGGLPALIEFYGARVRLYFNPLAPECIAKAVLAEAWRGHREGEVIGDMVQMDREVRHIRRAMGYGEDPDLRLSRQHSLALRRVAQGVSLRTATGGACTQHVEVRDGLGNAATIQTGEPVSQKASEPEVKAEEIASKRAEVARFEEENEALFI